MRGTDHVLHEFRGGKLEPGDLEGFMEGVTLALRDLQDGEDGN